MGSRLRHDVDDLGISFDMSELGIFSFCRCVSRLEQIVFLEDFLFSPTRNCSHYMLVFKTKKKKNPVNET